MAPEKNSWDSEGIIKALDSHWLDPLLMPTMWGFHPHQSSAAQTILRFEGFRKHTFRKGRIHRVRDDLNSFGMIQTQIWKSFPVKFGDSNSVSGFYINIPELRVLHIPFFIFYIPPWLHRTSQPRLLRYLRTPWGCCSCWSLPLDGDGNDHS